MKKRRTNKMLKWMVPLLSVGLVSTGSLLAEANGLPGSNTGDLIHASSMMEDAIAITVRGTVTSQEDNSGLPGVTVLEKGTNNGTVTDIDGVYTIDVSGPNAVLVFSYVGFDNQEITVGNRTTVNVTLEESISAMNEVVVTALGIERDERSLGYDVSTVDAEDVTQVSQENVLSSLAGRMPGVTINQTSGPGSSMSMVIRGATSLTSDNQPLFVVDGVPMSNSLNNVSQNGNGNQVDYGNAISDINPDDIASVSVLKGPSAAALYGTRAGNGVVIITTKSGKKARIWAFLSQQVTFLSDQPDCLISITDTPMVRERESSTMVQPIGVAPNWM